MNDYKIEREIKVIYKEVGKEARIIQIENSLEEKQKLVGGLFNVISYNDVLIICNEEAKRSNMKPNIIFDYDYIAGNCLVVGDDYERGDFKSLTNEQIKYVSNDFKKRSYNYKPNNCKRIYKNDYGIRSF